MNKKSKTSSQDSYQWNFQPYFVLLFHQPAIFESEMSERLSHPGVAIGECSITRMPSLFALKLVIILLPFHLQTLWSMAYSITYSRSSTDTFCPWHFTSLHLVSLDPLALDSSTSPSLLAHVPCYPTIPHLASLGPQVHNTSPYLVLPLWVHMPMKLAQSPFFTSFLVWQLIHTVQLRYRRKAKLSNFRSGIPDWSVLSY